MLRKRYGNWWHKLAKKLRPAGEKQLKTNLYAVENLAKINIHLGPR
jgi:hypothetical protein